MKRIFWLACVAGLALGQEFEVVSVKPNNSGSNSSSTNSNRGRLRAENVSLRSLVVMAYGMKDYQVEAPDWLGDQRFDLAAKFPEELPANNEKYNAALHAMMQKMLEERFKIAIHRGTKMFSVYGLTIGKNGIKFKEVPDNDSRSQHSSNTHYTGSCVSMPAFAEFLSHREDLPVIDMT
ncbi:MAG TPA: TIGR03435 family protein, partial [Bryobacteraceae bacterium]|nr:TIGR03435 family protein [Bryobacteraceae bacterium]